MPALKFIVEAALLAADEPLSVERLQSLFEESQPPSRDAVHRAVIRLQEDYAGRGVELVEVASGFRIQVRQELAPWVSRLWEERSMRYSRASLETLALIAYRQPITRGEIEEVRGVSVSSAIIKTLQDRGWIKVLGHREVPGRPALYGTTRAFLDYFNLKTLGELPPLAELRDLDAIGKQLDLLDSQVDEPTVASAEMPVDASEDTSADTSNDATPDLPSTPETTT
ncbi:MAG: SMC-Scp complex subunit ScpB [Candidatus Competibacteraceae bacterium]|jgi:segregation and condensation protein B|nr:SMC-Scp complex subunit ScpB [Candidatus Competibacteraceae bacterium]